MTAAYFVCNNFCRAAATTNICCFIFSLSFSPDKDKGNNNSETLAQVALRLILHWSSLFTPVRYIVTLNCVGISILGICANYFKFILMAESVTVLEPRGLYPVEPPSAAESVTVLEPRGLYPVEPPSMCSSSRKRRSSRCAILYNSL